MRPYEAVCIYLDCRKERYESFDQFINHKHDFDAFLKDVNIMVNVKDPEGRFSIAEYNFKLYRDNTEYNALKNKIQSFADVFLSYNSCEFFKAEFKNSPLLKIHTEIYFTGMTEKDPSIHGTVFNTEILCETCGLKKAAPKGQLYLDTSIMKHKKFQLEYTQGYALVTESLLNEFYKKNLCDFEAKPVIHMGEPKKEVITYQIIPHTILPPSQPCDFYFENLSDYCTECGINGRANYPLNLSLEQLKLAKHFNLTDELYGSSLAYRYWYISQEVKSILDEFKVKAWFTPMIIKS